MDIRTATYDLQIKNRVFNAIDPHNPTLIPAPAPARIRAGKLLPLGSRRRAFARFLVPRDSLRWRFLRKIYYILKPIGDLRLAKERRDNVNRRKGK